MFPATRNQWVTFDCYGTLFPRHRHAVPKPLDDVEALLAEFRLRGYRLGVLTNCDDRSFERAHRAFAQPFDMFVTAERVRAYKPAPWHFRAFQLLTGVCKQDWVHVSDSWSEDIVAAESLGIHRVWFDRGRTGEDPSRASAHVYTAREALTAVEGLLQERAVCAC